MCEHVPYIGFGPRRWRSGAAGSGASVKLVIEQWIAVKWVGGTAAAAAGPPADRSTDATAAARRRRGRRSPVAGRRVNLAQSFTKTAFVFIRDRMCDVIRSDPSDAVNFIGMCCIFRPHVQCRCLLTYTNVYTRVYNR